MMVAGLSCFLMSSDAISGDTAQIPVLISQVLAGQAVGMYWVAPPSFGVTPPDLNTHLEVWELPSCDAAGAGRGELSHPYQSIYLLLD